MKQSNKQIDASMKVLLSPKGLIVKRPIEKSSGCNCNYFSRYF